MRPFNEHTFPGERVIVSDLQETPLRVAAFPAGFFEHFMGEIVFKWKLPHRQSVREVPQKEAIPAGDTFGI